MAVKIDVGDDNPPAAPCGVAGEVVCGIFASLFCVVFLSAGQCAIGNGDSFVPHASVARNGSTSNGLAAGKDYQFKGRYEAEKNAVIISLEKDEREC